MYEKVISKRINANRYRAWRDRKQGMELTSRSLEDLFKKVDLSFQIMQGLGCSKGIYPQLIDRSRWKKVQSHSQQLCKAHFLVSYSKLRFANISSTSSTNSFILTLFLPFSDVSCLLGSS